MSDNTQLPNSDLIRDVQKGGPSGPKTQVVIVDAGGGGTENLLTAGPNVRANSIPITVATDQPPLPIQSLVQRAAASLIRNNVTTADVLAAPALAATTTSNSGSSLNGTIVYTAVSANNQGYSNATTWSTLAVASGQALRLAVTAVSGAQAYHFFVSNQSSLPVPAWLASVSATQVAAGGTLIQATGQVATNGTAPPGNVDILATGTGPYVTWSPFGASTAYVIPSSPAPLSCAGYRLVQVTCSLQVAGPQPLPGVVLVPMYQLASAPNQWWVGPRLTYTVLDRESFLIAGTPLSKVFWVPVEGCQSFYILVATLQGNQPSVNLVAEVIS
jgi:hypothetical protein